MHADQSEWMLAVAAESGIPRVPTLPGTIPLTRNCEKALEDPKEGPEGKKRGLGWRGLHRVVAIF